MSALSDVVERKVLDHLFGGTAMTQYSSFKIAVGTSAWSDSAEGTEVTTNTGSGNYERQSIAFTAAATSSGTSKVANSAQITFPAAPSNLGAIQYWAIYGTAGGTTEVVAHGQFSAGRTIATGDQLSIAQGALEITAD